MLWSAAKFTGKGKHNQHHYKAAKNFKRYFGELEEPVKQGFYFVDDHFQQSSFVRLVYVIY